jgi:hypothetical protein
MHTLGPQKGHETAKDVQLAPPQPPPDQHTRAPTARRTGFGNRSVKLENVILKDVWDSHTLGMGSRRPHGATQVQRKKQQQGKEGRGCRAGAHDRREPSSRTCGSRPTST